MGKKPEPELQIREDAVLGGIVTRIAGEHGIKVVEALAEEELTDEDLAKKTGVRLNLVRRILYDLYDNRVVTYRRVRNESTGWYIYYWRVEPGRAKEFLANNKRTLLQKLEERLEQERSTMTFGCGNGCGRLAFEQAAEVDFKCPRCGGKLGLYDNSGVIHALERQVEALRQQLVGS